MKEIRFLAIVLIAVTLVTGTIQVAQAVPPIPSSFYGEIHFMPADGGPNAGDTLHAYVDDGSSPAASTIITQSGDNLVYAINVPGYTADPQPSTVTFKIDDRTVAVADWVSGTNINLVIHPPKADPGGPYVAEQNETIAINGSASDWFTGESFTYAWDLDNDGEFDDSPLQNPDVSFAAPGIKTIRLKVTDSQGGVGIADTDVVVISISGLTGQVYAGDPKPVTVGGVSGPYAASILYGEAPGSPTAPVNAGTYPVEIEIKQGENVLRTITKSLVIDPRPITVTADIRQKVYGEVDPALTYEITSGNLVDGDSLSGSLVRLAGENVGYYLINQGSLTAGSNYNLTFVGATLEITPRPITVTADAKSKVYGDDDPSLTYEITFGNLVDGDSLSGSLVRLAGEDVDYYLINQGSLTAGSNYNLTFVGANLQITHRPITVTADDQSKVFGDPDPQLTYQVTTGSLVTGDEFLGGLTRVAGEDVGTYAIQQGTLALSANYALSFVEGTFTVTAGSVTVTATPGQSKVYGTADPVFAYTYSPDDPPIIFTGALSRDPGENVGTYAITKGTLAAENYTIIFNSADFAITPASATVSLSNLNQTYDGDPKPVTVTTVPPGVQVTVTYDDNPTVPTATGVYAVVATISDPNYVGGPASGTLVISTTHQISLEEGWNLVSFNLQPYPSDAPEDVLASIVGKYELVYAWDASGEHVSSGHWMKHDNIPQTTDTLTVLNEKMGFWILMNEAATLQVQGFMPTSTEINLLDDVGGWNLVGFPSSTSSALPAALEDHGVADDEYTLVYAYHAADMLDPWKLYDRNAPGYANDLLSMAPGWGYWIFVTEDADWVIGY